MNPELQQQTDLITKAIGDLERTLHQDLLLVLAALGLIIIVLCVAGLRRKK